MSRYTRDGGVVSAKTPVGTRSRNEHLTKFGLFRGIVIRSIYPDDKENSTGQRMEYVVKVKGQEYPNCSNLREAGGIYNYRERIRKASEKSYSGKIAKDTLDENLDGEIVYVMFLEGHGDVPIIVGSAQHPLQKKKYKKADKIFDVEEFQGIEWKVDKDGSYTITAVGMKDPDGKITNKDSVDAQFKIDGKTGNITINVPKDAKIFLASGDAEPDEPLVLGKVFQKYEKDFLAKLLTLEDKLADQAQQLSDQSTMLATMNTQLIAFDTALVSHVHPGVLPGGSSTGPSPALAGTGAAEIANRTADVTTNTTRSTTFATTKSDILQNKSDITDLKSSPIEDSKILSDVSFTKKKFS